MHSVYLKNKKKDKNSIWRTWNLKTGKSNKNQIKMLLSAIF